VTVAAIPAAAARARAWQYPRREDTCIAFACCR
jgi:hypothetical protein